MVFGLTGWGIYLAAGADSRRLRRVKKMAASRVNGS
jgi:hypothetical protein